MLGEITKPAHTACGFKIEAARDNARLMAGAHDRGEHMTMPNGAAHRVFVYGGFNTVQGVPQTLPFYAVPNAPYMLRVQIPKGRKVCDTLMYRVFIHIAANAGKVAQLNMGETFW